MARSNAVIGLLLTGVLFLACLLFLWIAPYLASQALVGLALAVGVLLSATFIRRAFYVQRQAPRAARTSLIFFTTVACGLWLATKVHALNSFSVFSILALGWIVAGAGFMKEIASNKPKKHFLELAPGYWREHWNYTRWSLATAFVFQFTTQGYYWVAPGILSVKQVAELRVMYLLVAPVDQIFIALSYLIIPALAARYASNRKEEFLSISKRYGLATVSATALFVLAVRVVGRPMMHWLYAGKFDDLMPLLYVLAFLPLLMGIGNAMSCALNAAEKPKLVFHAYVCGGAATVIGGIPLVIHFGLLGAVYGMLLSATTYSAALAVGFLPCVYGKART